MSFIVFLLFFFLFHSSIIISVVSKCSKSFECGRLGYLEFPLSNSRGCGLFTVHGCDSVNPTIQLEPGGQEYSILNISTNKFLVKDHSLQSLLDTNSCFSFINLTLPKYPSISFSFSPNLTMFECFNETYKSERGRYFENYLNYTCSLIALYYSFPTANVAPPVPNGDGLPSQCHVIQLPVKSNYDQQSPENVFDLFTSEYTLEWNLSEQCSECQRGGGQCLTNDIGEFECKR
ncbi:hypothetical protein MIMGU_mgv1a0215071mg, partial [Erythranthe guttata]